MNVIPMITFKSNLLIGASLSEPHHMRSTVESVFLLYTGIHTESSDKL